MKLIIVKYIINSYKINSLYHYFSNIFETVIKLKVCVDFQISRSLFSLRFKMSPSRELGEKASFVFILIFPFDNSLTIITSLHYAAASKSILCIWSSNTHLTTLSLLSLF